MTKKITAFLLSILTVTFFLAGCQKKSAETTGQHVLRVGTEGTYAPFSYHNDQGELTGYDVDVARAVAKKIGYDIEFVEAPWDAMLAAFDSGKSDVIFNQAGITPEREQKYLFSTPYAVSHPVLIIHKDNHTITGFSDVRGKVLAQTLMSNYVERAEELGATVTGTDGFSKTVQLVSEKRADGTLNDDIALYDYLKQKPDAPVKIVSVADDAVKSGAMLHKKDRALHKKIDQAIQELLADGTLAKLSDTYFNKDISK